MESILQRIIKRIHNNKKIIEKNIDDKKHINYNKKALILLKMWNSKTLKIQTRFQNCFKFSKLQQPFATYKWVIMYMMHVEKL
jgi:hypothetical protein